LSDPLYLSLAALSFSGLWSCPFGCTHTLGGVSPFCVFDTQPNVPCRIKIDRGKNNNDHSIALSTAEALEAERESATHAGMQECTAILATVRSGEYLR
jgi:hypothetical protein